MEQIAQTVIESLLDEGLRDMYSKQHLTDLFKQSIEEKKSVDHKKDSAYQVFFGSSNFPGLRIILNQLDTLGCSQKAVELFKERVDKQTAFVEQK